MAIATRTRRAHDLPTASTGSPSNAARSRMALVAATLLCSAGANAAETAPLAWFAGAWECAGSFASSGKPIAAHLRFDWDDATGALVKHHDDAPPNLYHATEMWGQAKSGGLSATTVDLFSGTRSFSSPGWSEDVLTWTRSIGAQPVERFTYVRQAADRMRVDWETSKDGATFKLGATRACVRSKNA